MGTIDRTSCTVVRRSLEPAASRSMRGCVDRCVNVYKQIGRIKQRQSDWGVERVRARLTVARRTEARSGWTRSPRCLGSSSPFGHGAGARLVDKGECPLVCPAEVGRLGTHGAAYEDAARSGACSGDDLEFRSSPPTACRQCHIRLCDDLVHSLKLQRRIGQSHFLTAEGIP